MVNKRKLFLFFMCFLVVLSSGVSAFAIEQPDLDTYAFNKVVSPLGLDTFILSGNGPDVYFSNPFYSAFVDDGYNLDYNIAYNSFWKDDPSPSEEEETLTVFPQSYQSITSGVYQVGAGLYSSRFGLENSFTFSNSSPVLCSLEMLDYASYSVVAVPANVRYSYRITIRGSYVSPNAVSGQLEEHSYNQVLTYSYLNNSGYTSSHPMFPNVSEYTSLADAVGVFVIDSISCVYEFSSSSSIPYIQLYPAYVETSMLPSFAEYEDNHPNYIDVSPGTPGDPSFDLGSFLKNTVGAFLSVEFIPGISLGGIAATIVGVVAFIAFLKIFAGG